MPTGIRLGITCGICGSGYSIACSEEQYRQYLAREKNIQDIFPELSADIRELLLSGICGTCYDKLCGDED
jgi:hypothetical protein